jgi:hypothetical protein
MLAKGQKVPSTCKKCDHKHWPFEGCIVEQVEAPPVSRSVPWHDNEDHFKPRVGVYMGKPIREEDRDG